MDAHSPPVGAIFAERFRIEALIASGGFGRVYAARHIALNTRVALKVLRSNHVSSPQIRKRFIREARVLAELRHPGIVKILDLGETAEGMIYLVMELLPGHTLAAELRTRAMPTEQITHIVQAIAEALTFAHERGVIHRDLKPSNIMICPNAGSACIVKVIDFGILKHHDNTKNPIDDGITRSITHSHAVLGTPYYMAPEQIRGERVDARCDIYALAAVTYEMLTGKVPFEGDSHMDILTAHLREPLPSIKSLSDGTPTPEGLDAVLSQGMAKDHEERFKTTQAYASILKNCLEGRLRDATTDVIQVAAPSLPDAPNETPIPVAKPAADDTITFVSSDNLPTQIVEMQVPRPKWAVPAGIAAVGVITAFFWFSATAPVSEPSAAAQAETEAPAAMNGAAHRARRGLEEATRCAPRRMERQMRRFPEREAPMPLRPTARLSQSPPKAMPHLASTPSNTKAAPASLSVLPRPTGAVSIDGIAHGDMGVIGLEVRPGWHTVRVNRPGEGVPKKIRVRLQPGVRYRLAVDLDKGTHALHEIP